MTQKPKVVAVCGSLKFPSRTLVLVEELIAALGARASFDAHLIKLADIGPRVGAALQAAELPARVRADIEAIEHADFIIAASPVYQASYTGLFKHLFEFVDYNALAGVPVMLAATGGSERHSLILDHQLRPLFAFFRALTLPMGIYASEADFDHYQLVSPAVKAYIALAVEQAHAHLRPRQSGG
ncbi:MAG: FMN reductase [Azoarcus sp.]|nr:FMN reductase [Azoarcus sp.]